MPPIRHAPFRPRRVWTFSRDRLRLSSGGGVIGFVFGLVFSSSGVLVLLALALNFRTIAELSLRDRLVAVVGMLLLGAAHLAVGTHLLSTLRATFDRARNVVTISSGWLGIRRRRENLAKFRRVIAPQDPATASSRVTCYDVALEDQQGRVVVVGHVTQSHALAREVAAEVAKFTELSA